MYLNFKGENMFKKDPRDKHLFRRFSALFCIVAMILCLVPTTVKAQDVGSGETGARAATVSGNVFLGGNYMEIGISPCGSFGTTADAPTTGDLVFHPSTIFGNTNAKIGMVANSSVTGETNGWNKETTDYFLPGTVDESFSIGWDNTLKAVGSDYGVNMNTANLSNTSTVNESTAELLKAVSTGTITGTGVTYSQTISFAPNDKNFTTTITLTNDSANTISGTRYMRAFDPDQQSNTNILGTTETYDLVGIPGLENVGTSVIAYGDSAGTITPFFFFSEDKRATAGYTKDFQFCFTDLYNAGNHMVTTQGSTLYEDGDIFIYFELGDIPAGGSTTFSYISSLDVNPANAIASIKNKYVPTATVPSTGDDSMAMIWIYLGLLASAGLATSLVISAKRRNA